MTLRAAQPQALGVPGSGLGLRGAQDLKLTLGVLALRKELCLRSSAGLEHRQRGGDGKAPLSNPAASCHLI